MAVYCYEAFLLKNTMCSVPHYEIVDCLFANPYKQDIGVGMGVNDERYLSQTYLALYLNKVKRESLISSPYQVQERIFPVEFKCWVMLCLSKYFVVKNVHPNDTCYDEIGLCARYSINQSSSDWEHDWECDHLERESSI